MNEEDSPRAQPPVQLFFKSREPEIPSQPPSWLARKMGLPLYSNVLLTKKVRTEMNFAAGLLLLVGVFEWLLWMLLFNGIYSSDIFHLGFATLFAALTAVFFGVAVFWFERQMLTSSEKGWRLWLAMGFRVIYIFIAALITSQTFELMLFQKPIQERAREEGIRGSAAKHYLDVLEAEANALNAPSLVQKTTTIEGTNLSAVRKERQREENSRNHLQTQLATAQDEGDTLRINKYNRLLLESQSRLDVLRERERDAEKALENRGHEIEQERTNIVQNAPALRDRFQRWAELLRNSKPGMPVADGKGWTYSDPQPRFFEQLFLLADLTEGRPAAWPGATPEVRDALRNQFGFYEPPACPEPGSSPQLANAGEQQAAQVMDITQDCERRRSNTRIFNRAWWAGIGIAMLIPMLILIIKAFLLPEELRFYYSRLHQAELGDVEALNVTQADERLRSAQTRDTRG
jgi:hypothetical protein